MAILSSEVHSAGGIGRLCRPALALVALLAALEAAGTAEPEQPAPRRVESLPEYVSKAAFLYNFAKYVEWPPDAFPDAAAPISIGIVGKDPFGEDLEKTLKDRKVNERGIKARRFQRPAEIERCHILFVPRSETARLRDIFRRADAWPTLTVGEDEGFCKAGGAISILIEKEKPRLEVNLDAAGKAKLTINSKLLKVATILKTGK